MLWRPYVPVAVRRARALREMNRLRKKGKDIQPVEIEGRTIARSVWGKRWCDHLESYSDYANRLPRGRAYVRNGSVCHLEVHPGRIDAIVSGSELYTVSVQIKKLKAAVWKSIKARCSGQIASMLELLQGKLSRQVMSVVSDRERGLFPKPREIDFTCTCPDWATMCKHVAAVLYGVGGRLDRHPEALFLLRGVDAEELIAAEISLPASAAGDDTLADDALAGIFGIDIDTGAVSDMDTASTPAEAPARTRKGGRQRASSATGQRAAATAGRRAPRTRKARATSASASGASAGRRTRKAGTGATRRGETPAKREDASGTPPSATRGGESSPAAAPRAALRPAKRASASGVSRERARQAASNAARGRRTTPAAAPRKRGAVKSAATSTTKLRPTGKSVARLRRRCGLSVAEFASRLGVSPVTVYRWEATADRLNLQARTLGALTRLHRRTVTRKKR